MSSVTSVLLLPAYSPHQIYIPPCFLQSFSSPLHLCIWTRIGMFVHTVFLSQANSPGTNCTFRFARNPLFFQNLTENLFLLLPQLLSSWRGQTVYTLLYLFFIYIYIPILCVYEWYVIVHAWFYTCTLNCCCKNRPFTNTVIVITTTNSAATTMNSVLVMGIHSTSSLCLFKGLCSIQLHHNPITAVCLCTAAAVPSVRPSSFGQPVLLPR